MRFNNTQTCDDYYTIQRPIGLKNKAVIEIMYTDHKKNKPA